MNIYRAQWKSANSGIVREEQCWWDRIAPLALAGTIIASRRYRVATRGGEGEGCVGNAVEVFRRKHVDM